MNKNNKVTLLGFNVETQEAYVPSR
jgi:hypothetical protein